MRLVENKSGYFFQIDNEMTDIWLRILKPNSFIVYCVLARMTNEKGIIFPNVSQQDWAQYCGISKVTFQSSIKELKKYNLIEARTPKGKDRLQHKPTIYILNRLDEVVIYERDLPEPFPSDCTFIDPIYEYERVKNNSMFRTKKEKEANYTAGGLKIIPPEGKKLALQYIRKNIIRKNIISTSKEVLLLEEENKKPKFRLKSQKIISEYNKIASSCNIPSVQKLTDDRRNKMRIRAESFDCFSVEDWKEVFNNIPESKFLNGDNDRGWTITFDWLIASDKNFAKLVEKNYKDKKKNKTRLGGAKVIPGKYAAAQKERERREAEETE